jgi:DNA primase
LRLISKTIKDEFIKKYVLEYFLENISSLTPYSNKNKNQLFTKKIKSLKSTQKYFNESKSLSPIELKEFSFLYLIINNLKIIKENIYLINNVKLFTTENKIVFASILSNISKDGVCTIEDLLIDEQIINKIFKFASIKHILNNYQNSQDKILELLEEILRDLKNYELEIRIEELESKFSKDLSESTFNEIKQLKKLQNIN